MMMAETIIGIDLMDYRLESATGVGATHVVNPSQSSNIEMVSKITNGQMVDLAIEAVGKDSTVNDCFPLVKRSGVVLAFGVPRKSIYDSRLGRLTLKSIMLALACRVTHQ